MKQITETEIERVTELLELKEKPLKYLFESMDRREPELFNYIATIDEDEFNDYERSILMAAAATGWHIIEQVKGHNDHIRDFLIDDQLERNIDLFDGYFEGNSDNRNIKKMFIVYNDQPFLIAFLMDFMLNQPPVHNSQLRDDRIFLLSLHLKTVIDCLVVNEEDPVKH